MIQRGRDPTCSCLTGVTQRGREMPHPIGPREMGQLGPSWEKGEVCFKG